MVFRLDGKSKPETYSEFFHNMPTVQNLDAEKVIEILEELCKEGNNDQKLNIQAEGFSLDGNYYGLMRTKMIYSSKDSKQPAKPIVQQLNKGSWVKYGRELRAGVHSINLTVKTNEK